MVRQAPRLARELEEARSATTRLKKEHEVEREKIKKALGEFKKKADRYDLFKETK